MTQCLYIQTWTCVHPNIEDSTLTVDMCDACLKARKAKAEIDLILADTELITESDEKLRAQEEEAVEEEPLE